MKVTLIAYSQINPKLIEDRDWHYEIESEPEWICALGKRSCNTKASLDKIINFNDSIKVRRRIKSAIKDAHGGTLEHANFTFLIEGDSRVFTHQLVRHRIVSYLQMSQRKVPLYDMKMIYPSSYGEHRQRVEEFVEEAMGLYHFLIDAGVPPEDARYHMPHGMETRIFMTINGRSLMHLFRLRTKSPPAQWEFCNIANRMLELVREVCPNMFVEELREYWE